MSVDCLYREQAGPVTRIDFNRFRFLNPSGQQLVRGWFDRAYAAKDDTAECFETFIFAWFAVNGWAACVTGKDRDADYIRGLQRSADLSEKFQELLSQDEGFNRVASEFHSYWPIFRAQDIRRAAYQSPVVSDRAVVIEYYFDHDLSVYKPQCWKAHHDAGEPVPLDWAHTLNTIYRVRCNLFHGEKSVHSEMDHAIVSAAYHVLIGFFRGAKIL